MIRTLAAIAAFATLALAGAASAQTYGQPVYLNAYGRPVGGTPLSEVETRPYVGTGRWADGYSDRPQVYVPVPGYGRDHGQTYGRGRYGHGYGRAYGGYGRTYGGYGRPRHAPPRRSGYRDEWGYDDDRPFPARRGWDDRRSRRYDGDCGCGDVYLYDR